MEMMMMTMQMYFEAGSRVTILFKQWNTNNEIGKMVIACIALMILGFLYEGLKVARRHFARRNRSIQPMIAGNHRRSRIQEETGDVAKTENPPRVAEHSSVKFIRQQRISMHLVQTLLHVLQVCLGYVLMLTVMTFNVWICLAVVAGSGLGYLVFGWKSSMNIDDADHCN